MIAACDTHQDRTDGPDNFFRSFFVPGVPAWSGTAPKTRHRTPSMRWSTTLIAEKEVAASISEAADCELDRLRRTAPTGRASCECRPALQLCGRNGAKAGVGMRRQAAGGVVLRARARHGPRQTGLADGSTKQLRRGTLSRSNPDTGSAILLADPSHPGRGRGTESRVRRARRSGFHGLQQPGRCTPARGPNQ